MRYKIILKTTSKHRHRISNCLTTWLSELDHIFLTDNLLGDIGDEFSGSQRTDYSSNEQKTVNFINHCIMSKKYNEYDWFIFIDDDAIINKKAIEYILPFFNKQYVYGLRMRGSWPKDTTLDFPSGGSGYFISPYLIDQLSKMTEKGHGQEDVSMGEWLRENNISIKDTFNINDTQFKLKLNGWYPFSDIEDKTCNLINMINAEKREFLKKHITHHYIKEKCLMEYIYQIFLEWKYTNLERTS